MPLAQDHLATVRKAVGTVLRRQGFQAQTKRSWIRGDDDAGWVVVAWQGDKWNTKQAAEATLDAAVWPPGTREHHAELTGTDTAPFAAANAPLASDARGPDHDAPPDSFAVTSRLSGEDLTALRARAEHHAALLASWSARMLDARVSAPLMRDGFAVAALLSGHPGAPELDPRLDLLTARFQGDPRPIALGEIIGRWRQERGLRDVPLPSWSRYASRPYAPGHLASPRDELLAGIGGAVDFSFADGTSRAPRPEDLPDAVVLNRWREERARAPVPDGVLDELPPWLPYAAWLDLPEPEPTPRRRWRWRR